MNGLFVKRWSPLLKNMKLGIPFNVLDSKGAIKGLTYIQLENGNFGHGALDGWACLAK